MSRLPTVGGDDGNWGTVLNDFLSVSLNSDGTLSTGLLKTGGTMTGALTITPTSDSANLFKVTNSANTTTLLKLDSVSNLITINGSLVFATATSKLIPGATSFNIRNNADTATHFSVTDAGQVTIYPDTTTTGFPNTAIGIQLGTTSNTYTTPSGTGTALVRIDGNFKTADSTGYVRAFSTEVHWTDSVNGTSTFAAAYCNIYHDGAATDIQDLIGVIGRVFVTSTGLSSVGTWGVRGDINFTTGTTTSTVITSAAAVVGHLGSWSTPVTITTYSQLEAKSAVLNTGGAVVTDGYGALIGMPSSATGNNVGVQIGTRYTGTISALGLLVGSNGAWFKGQMAIPFADTTSGNSTIALAAGDSGSNNSLVALYFYRSSTSKGYIGFDSDASTVIAGHTKGLNDLVLVSAKLVVDANGQIFAANNIAAASYTLVQNVASSGNIPGPYTFTGAAHTGLSNGSNAEFNYNFARTVTFGSSGTTIATLYNMQIQAPTYAAGASTTITKAATVRITNQPQVGTNITFTQSAALQIDAGAIALGAGVNFILDTATGTKIGTATTQKLGFYNSTPIVQPTASSDATSFVAGGGTTATSTSTWTGASGSSAYTVGGIVTQLKALGLLAA